MMKRQSADDADFAEHDRGADQESVKSAQSADKFDVLSRGVTLIELLAAITLLGMVSLALLFSLRIGSSAWQRANARMAADRRVVAAADLLSTQLADARPRRVFWGPPERPASFAYFEGAPNRLRFLTSYSLAARSRGGLWLAEYSIEGDSGTCRLLYNEWPFRMDSDVAWTVREAGFDAGKNRMVVDFSPPARDPEPRELHRNLEKCGFEYLIEPPQGEAFWGPQWETNSQFLPRAVALRFKGKETGGIAPVATVATLPWREVLP